MPETDDLDAAFEAFARRTATTAGRPGAAAAVRTVRARRRRSVAGVAVVAAVTAGAVSAPQLLPEHLPGLVAGAPDSARLDPAALEHATAGWIDGWSASDTDAREFTAASCAVALELEHGSATVGRSFFTEPSGAGALVVIYDFEGDAHLEQAWDEHESWLSSCADFVVSKDSPDVGEGNELVHAAAVYGADADPGHRLSDVWIARAGDRLAMVEIITDAGPAPKDVVTDVGTAVLAGTRDGWTEESSPVVEQPPLRPQLPSTDNSGLREALRGWLRGRPADAPPAPGHPCLRLLEEAGTAGSSTESNPRGWFFGIVGYDDDGTGAAEQVRQRAAELESCTKDALVRRDLAGGVVSYTYDLGDDGGHGSIWLAHNVDRAMLVTVHGGEEPVPAGATDEVGVWIRSVLAMPWPEAS